MEDLPTPSIEAPPLANALIVAIIFRMLKSLA
jgi:hypothetical protein